MTLMDWISIASVVFLTGTIIVSWLASYRAPKARTFGSGKWFALSVWAQISLGIIAVLLFIIIGYALWAPLLFFLLFLFSLYRRAQREEAALAITFGEEWHKDAARVPTFLPGLRGRDVEEGEG